MGCELDIVTAKVQRFPNLPDPFMSEDINNVKEKINDFHAQTEDYVRANPTQAVFSAVAAGFVLRLLPIGAIVGAIVRLAFFALRPAVFIYGAVALYKHFQTQQGQGDQQQGQ